MSESIKLPALGESVTEGTVTRWLKEVGDTIEVDEPLVEISTDKVDTEVPSPIAGTIEQILVAEDETVEVGAVLAIVGDGSGASSSDDGAAPAAEAAPAPAPEAAPAPAAEPAPAAAAAPAAESAPAAGGDGQEVTLPALGESVTEATVTRWLKEVGDSVEVDEALLEISTDKVDTEVPSPFAGVVQQILVGEDDTAEVGAVLAIIGSGAAAPAAAPAPAAPAAAPAPAAPAAPAAAAPAPAAAAPAPAAEAPATGGTSYVTPVVRKLASDGGIDLGSLVGTGVGGRVRREDVVAAIAQKEAEARAAAAPAAAAPAAAPAAPAAKSPAPLEASPLRGTTEKASRLRQIIAERMVEALQTQAQLTTVVEVDVTKIVALRAKAKESFRAREGANLTFLPFYVLAATEALKAHPKINGVLEDKTITYHGAEHVGIAVDTDRGLLVPVIKDAGDLNLAGIARKIVDLATRTRDNKVTPDELSGATFTITNTGSGGALFDTPIVPGGTSAILGTGAIVKRPRVIKTEEGQEVIAVRSVSYLSISYDHRLVDGADASRYLTDVKRRLEAGDFEAELGL